MQDVARNLYLDTLLALANMTKELDAKNPDDKRGWLEREIEREYALIRDAVYVDTKKPFTNTDFEKIPLDGSDFVYADPPYDVEFTQYSKGGFDWDEQERAAEWLSRHEGPVILSNQATARIVKLYRSLKFTLKFRNAPRRISCTGDRTPAPEVLAVRNLK